MARLALHITAALAAFALAACAEHATLPESAGYGPNVQLPPPSLSLLPTLEVAPAKGWPANRRPTPASGFSVEPFATGLEHPRWLHVLPNGDVLVAETAAPPQPEDKKGPRGWVMGLVFKRVGAGVPSANRITLLRDADGDGVAETRTRFIEGLSSPFGMALAGKKLYVANTDSLLRFDYRPGTTRIEGDGERVTDLPAGPINHHWTKNVIASRDGALLYVSVGSNSNVAENGLTAEERRAAILEVDAKSGRSRVFASGLRNPVGLAWNATTRELWTAVNERDELGSDLVPDYMTSVKDGGFYGWPFSYYGRHVDERVKPGRPDLVAKAIVPDYALGAHTASLGLTFYDGTMLAKRYRGGAFVGQHGSWNRKPPAGYRVIFVPFTNGRPSGPPEEILTGFIDANGNAQGRPVGVAVDRRGALLVADDVGNTVWRVTPADPGAMRVAAR